MKLRKFTQTTKNPRTRYQVNLLKDQNVNQAFRIKVANKFQILQDLQEDAEDSVESVEQVWPRQQRKRGRNLAKKSWE